jgi:hypothetical protein
MATVRRDSPCSIASLCGREATTHNNLDVATKKNPKQGTRLGVWSLLPHLGFCGLGGGGRGLMPPGLA